MEGTTRLQAGLFLAPFTHFLSDWRPLKRLQVNSGILAVRGRFMLKENWRPPSPEELSLLTVQDHDLTEHMVSSSNLFWLFTIPNRLLRMGRVLDLEQCLAAPEGCLPAVPEAANFISELFDFLWFIRAPLSDKCAVRIEVRRPWSLSGLDENSPSLPGGLHRDAAELPGALAPLKGFSAIINLGIQPRSLAFINLASAQLRIMLPRLERLKAEHNNPAEDDLAACFMMNHPDYPVTKAQIAPGEGCFARLDEIIHAGYTAGMTEPDVNLVITPGSVSLDPPPGSIPALPNPH